jgi:hypothetical protein
MGVHCLSECPACSRHLQCGERSCPFCGARVTSLMRVLDYRLTSQLNRSRLFSIGAALTAAGFAVGCEETQSVAAYGAPCNPPSCVFGGETSAAGKAGSDHGGSGMGGNATTGGMGGTAGADVTGGSGGTAPEGGAAGEGGFSTDGGSAVEGGAAGQAGGDSGAGGGT